MSKSNEVEVDPMQYMSLKAQVFQTVINNGGDLEFAKLAWAWVIE